MIVESSNYVSGGEGDRNKVYARELRQQQGAPTIGTNPPTVSMYSFRPLNSGRRIVEGLRRNSETSLHMYHSKPV